MSVFDEVRGRVSIEQAISYLGLKPTESKSDQFRFPCPACAGTDKRTLSVNLTKGFQCFSSGKRGDDATALVAHCKGIRQRDAAEELKAHFLGSSTEARPAKAELKGRPEAAGSFRPLDFHDWEHPVMDLLKISPGVLRAIGGGIDHTDLLDERICIPLRMEDGALVGYLAIATKPDQSPLILFWPEDMAVYIEPEKRSQDEMRKLLRVV